MLQFLQRLFFRARSPQPTEILDLHFASSEAAFRYACDFMNCELREGVGLPALVLDSSRKYGTPSTVAVAGGGIQTALLLVASKDGGFDVHAETFGSNGPRLKPGDLVAWKAVELIELAPLNDKRSEWCGFILGTLKPSWSPAIGWIGDKRFN